MAGDQAPVQSPWFELSAIVLGAVTRVRVEPRPQRPQTAGAHLRGGGEPSVPLAIRGSCNISWSGTQLGGPRLSLLNGGQSRVRWTRVSGKITRVRLGRSVRVLGRLPGWRTIQLQPVVYEATLSVSFDHARTAVQGQTGWAPLLASHLIGVHLRSLRTSAKCSGTSGGRRPLVAAAPLSLNGGRPAVRRTRVSVQVDNSGPLRGGRFGW